MAERKSRSDKTKAEQAQADSDSPQVPAGTQVSAAAGAPRRVQDVEGNAVDEPLGEDGSPK